MYQPDGEYRQILHTKSCPVCGTIGYHQCLGLPMDFDFLSQMHRLVQIPNSVMYQNNTGNLIARRERILNFMLQEVGIGMP